MIRFRQTTGMDIPQLAEWILADEDHRGKMTADWWLKGDILNCGVEDGHGVVMYMRFDKDDDRSRVHIQFALEIVVSKMRVAAAFLEGLPRMATTLSQMGFGPMIFESVSPPLIAFMGRMGFTHEKGNEFVRAV